MLARHSFVVAWTSFSLLCAWGADSEPAPLAQAVRNRDLVRRYAPSVVTVRYWMRKNAEGDEPKFELPYRCPNCSETHWRDDGSSCEQGIPAEFVGFVLAPDRVLMQDLFIPPEFVSRIEVVAGTNVVGASELLRSTDGDALVLQTECPLREVRPLAFTGRATPDPRYFFLVRENGLTVAGLKASKATDFRHYVELDREVYEGQVNTLVLDGQGAPVTVALKRRVELGQESFIPPERWSFEPATNRLARLKDLEARLLKGVFPVYLQLEARSKDNRGFGRMRWSSSSDSDKNDIDAIGLLLEDGKVLVAANLSVEAIARLSKMEAILPGGRKVPLRFFGSYRNYKALVATWPEDNPPSGLRPLVRNGAALRDLWGQSFSRFIVQNNGGRFWIRRGTVSVSEFKRVRGNQLLPVFGLETGFRASSSEGGLQVVLADDGRLTGLSVADRRDAERWSSNETLVGATALNSLLSSPEFDAENVPRSQEDRRRTPWLGVEVQPASQEVLRTQGALAFLKDSYGDRAAQVSGVVPQSPADRLGIKPGAILVSVRYPGARSSESLVLENDYGTGIDWTKAFEDPRFLEAGNLGQFMPWPNAEGGINGKLASFGVGAEVTVAWVSDGALREGTTRLELAPVHFQNAPRARSKELGLTVCDMTYEVRKYLKLTDRDPGVVIAKVKGGGVAAVAGLLPLEIVTHINGVGVTGAKDFVAKAKGQPDLTLTVRRLNATRIVPVHP